MEFRILGLLEVLDDDRGARIARGQESTLLAALLVHANEPVTTDALVDALWQGGPPANAAKSVQIYVSRLRRNLGAERIRTTPAGYVLEAAPGELDSERFERAVEEGRAALESGDPGRAEGLLGEGLALWRGAALADFRFHEFALPEIRRLEQVRAGARCDLIDARLALGRGEELIPELEALVEESPHEERPRRQLMLALYRTGRQADALELYRRTRRSFADELGLEPSADLRELEQAILRQDPALSVTRPSLATRARRTRRRSYALIAVGGLALAGALLGFVLTRAGGAKPFPVRSDSVAVIDPLSDSVVADVPVGGGPVRVVTGDDAVWVINGADHTLTRIDPTSLRTRTTGLPAEPTGLAVDGRAVWVANGSAGTITRIDSRSGVTATVPPEPEVYRRHGTAGALAFDGRSVWGEVGIELVRLTWNEERGTAAARRVAYLASPAGPNALAVSRGVASSLGRGVLINLDLVSGQPSAVQIGAPLPDSFGNGVVAVGVAAGNGSVWATNPYEGLVEEVSPETGTALGSARTPGRPVDVAVGDGTAWSAGLEGDVSAIDVDTLTVRRTLHLGQPATSVAIGYGRVWVAVTSS